MLELIGEMVQNILDNYDLTDYCGGVVVTADPLTVQIKDNLELSEGNLILTSAVSDFKSGDKLTMLRVMRGQKYIILAKAVD